MSRAIITVLTLLLVACTPRPITTSAENAVTATDKMVYVKDHRTGLCFGVMSSYAPSIIDDTNSISATNVPCDAVKDRLINK